MLNENKFGENLKKIRTEKGLSQGELGKILFVSAQTVSKWENGLSFPDMTNLCALANALGVSSDSLLWASHPSELPDIYIGIDGGGSKTEIIVFKDNGEICDRVVTVGTNPNIYGLEKICETLMTTVDGMLSSVSGNLRAIYAGIAGSGVGKNAAVICECFKNAYPNAKIRVESDSYNVLSSVRGTEYGIAVICGTGINVSAYTPFGMRRFGGWGYLFDNFGSGYDIGNAVLRHCLAVYDGLEPESYLSKKAEQTLGGRAAAMLDRIYSKGKDFIASFAPLAFEAYICGDAKASEIIECNTSHIAKLLEAAIKEFDRLPPIVMSGGLMNYKDIIIPLISKKLSFEPNITVPQMPQSYGACLACLKLCEKENCIIEEFENNFNINLKNYK